MEVIEIERKLSEVRAAVGRTIKLGEPASAAQFRALIDALETLLTEVNLPHPNIQALLTLSAELQANLSDIKIKAAREWASGNPAASLGDPAYLRDTEEIIAELGKQVVHKVNEWTGEINAVAESIENAKVDAISNQAENAPMTDLNRQELDAKLAASEAKIDARLANFDTSIQTGFAQARTEMAEMRADMHKMHAEIKTWTLATMITIIGTMLAAIFGIATIFNNASKAAPPAQAQQPLVIYAQPAPAPSPLPAPK